MIAFNNEVFVFAGSNDNNSLSSGEKWVGHLIIQLHQTNIIYRNIVILLLYARSGDTKTG